MTWLLFLYGILAGVSLLNLALMRRLRPRQATNESSFCVLIPARNEAANIGELVSQVVREGLKVYVYDDASEDDTAALAAGAGATVLRGVGPPEGWLGKNHACHQLAKAAAEDFSGAWMVYLDADTRVEPGFAGALQEWIAERGTWIPVLTGFPRVLPGQGVEPLFLAWVGWILLASNPFGLVSRTGVNHNRFLNGQFVMWRQDVYVRLWPHEQLKAAVLEDVRIGRLLAREKVPVDVVNLSAILRVRMYETWRQTLDGMSKNSYEIMGSAVGTVLFALLLAVLGWGWLALGSRWWLGLGLLTLSGVAVAQTARTIFWPTLLMPVACLIGAFTCVRSLVWHRRGIAVWKGRRVG